MTVPSLAAMQNAVRDYDWGSPATLARLQGRTPSGGPEAELWMGAHPGAPSTLILHDGSRLPLPVAIERDPQATLGSATLARFGVRLPFLLKLLAIEKPLSVQVHPNAARAREVYRPDGSSPYGDPYHKPEMLVPLEPTEILFGFRPAAQAAELIGRLGSARLAPLVAALGTSSSDGDAELLHAALEQLVTWPLGDRAALVAEITAGAGRLQDSDYPQAYSWVDRLVGLHPADPMVLAPLLLDLLRLTPGQAVFVPAGVPHCYLSGFGVEILAASDNVLRCGLTSKAIAVDELLAVIDCRPLIGMGAPSVRLGEHETAWRPAAEEFQLTRLEVDSADTLTASHEVAGPQIVLCTRGKVQLHTGDATVALTAGYSAFVSADAGPLTVTGDGDLFRAAPACPESAI